MSSIKPPSSGGAGKPTGIEKVSEAEPGHKAEGPGRASFAESLQKVRNDSEAQAAVTSQAAVAEVLASFESKDISRSEAIDTLVAQAVVKLGDVSPTEQEEFANHLRVLFDEDPGLRKLLDPTE